MRAELERHYLDDAAEKDMKRRFKAFGQEPSFLIVCDKLLTGFDAPIEHVMYLDKPLKEHGLLQAIARTNRTCSVKRPDGGEITKSNGRIVDYIGVTNHLDEALKSYRSEDVENAMRDIAILRNDLKEAHARYRVQKRAMGLEGLDEKTAAYAVGKFAADGREDEWFDLQRLARLFIKTYGDLSPDPAILDFTAEVKWAAAFLRLATQVIAKDESLDHRSYSGKIRDMLEEHVHVTGLSTTIRLRNITDPNFADDFDIEKTEAELQEAFVRKSAELRRVTRELVDKNPAQYGRFSERVLEIIRRFEAGQIAAADGLREFEDLTGGIVAEQGAHAELGMDEQAFSILRIVETLAPDTEHAVLQDAAITIGAVYAEAQASQPAFTHMPEYLRGLRQQTRRILAERGIGETKAVREAVEEFAVHAYGDKG
ncbi:MAG: Type site-specific deoxyribonuclease, HsdR family [Rhizobium sp.]|nr:Type site-specific deoxyribonuclease, HsdR family [Rhizobium sp.]